MVVKFQALFSPVRIGSLTLRNRLVKTPVTSGLGSEDGFVNESIKERYRREALGGLGAITLEPLIIQPSKSPYNLRLDDDCFIPDLKGLVATMRDQDGDLKIGAQLIYFPKVAKGGWRQKVEDLTISDLEKALQYHAAAAKRIIACGFDYLELHMAHITVCCSMMSLLNTRQDEYGGNLAGRLRFPMDIVNAVRHSVGDDFPIGVRIDGDEFVLGGNTLRQSTRIAWKMAEAGVNYISVSAGEKYEDALRPPPNLPIDATSGYSGSRMSPCWSYPDGANVFLAETIREYIRTTGSMIPIVTAGKIRSPVHAEEILARDKADIIGIARAAICDPDWARKANEGRENEIVRCAACNECLGAIRAMSHVRCTRWPERAENAPMPFRPEMARPAPVPKDFDS